MGRCATSGAFQMLDRHPVQQRGPRGEPPPGLVSIDLAFVEELRNRRRKGYWRVGGIPRTLEGLVSRAAAGAQDGVEYIRSLPPAGAPPAAVIVSGPPSWVLPGFR